VRAAIATVLLLCATAFAQEHKVGVLSYEAPQYPVIARAARVQGTVRLQLKINPDGSVLSVDVLSGHPLLAASTATTMRKWRFACLDCSFGQEFNLVVAVKYRVGVLPCDYYSPKLHYTRYSFPYDVEVFRYPPEATCNDCNEAELERNCEKQVWDAWPKNTALP